MKLAITGKGGVGKTTLAGVLARIYAAEGVPVIAIDADPDANLASAFAFAPDLAEQVVPIARMEALVEERTGMKPGTTGGFFTINPRVDDLPDSLSVEQHGIKLLVLGTVKKGGAGCICAESTLLRSLVRHLLVKRNEVVLMDMEAGIEHLGRGTAEAADGMIVVVEPGSRSVQTAHAVQRLARDLGIKQVAVVGNKVRDEDDMQFIRDGVPGIPVLGFMSYDADIAKADMRGVSPYDANERLVEEIRAIKEELVKRF